MQAKFVMTVMMGRDEAIRTWREQSREERTGEERYMGDKMYLRMMSTSTLGASSKRLGQGKSSSRGASGNGSKSMGD